MLPWPNSRRRRADAAACALYDAVVAQARQPGFYETLGVPDSVDGRFEMIVLHAHPVMRRLREAGEAAVAQALFDRMFADMDRNLREMGVGDLSVGKHIRAMAEGLYGRARAYDRGLDAADERDLHEALARNLYGTAPAPPGALEAMAAYLRAVHGGLAARPGAALAGGELLFPPPPAGPSAP